MNVIRILPEKVASKIAAGEVIDRPASVVKELIDNSVDAGAERVWVRIEKGGKWLIKVSDNGRGMSRDDLLLCVERHATSKIESVSDLFSVKTLGFRGEALPSIASVSKMQIVSRPLKDLSGHRLRISGGKLLGVQEIGTPGGTIVEVRDLFFNVPARRKFLRAPKTEADHILDILSRLSLPFPRIHFRLEEESKTILNLPSSKDRLSRISNLLGRRVAEEMLEIAEETPEVNIRAYLAPFQFSRARADHLYIYVNGRNVRDRLVLRAVMEGYGQRLMKGRYPQAVLFLEIDPSKVDVNVHPTKQEVRFRHNQSVFQAIANSIDAVFNQPLGRLLGMGSDSTRERSLSAGDEPGMSEPMWAYSDASQREWKPSEPVKQEELSVLGEIQIIGQLKNTYILCQTRDGLLMIDQHAAHERILYESLKRSWTSSQFESQGLLMPLPLELSVREHRTFLEKGDQIGRLGFELEPFGGKTFLLRSVPSLLAGAEWENLLRDLLSQLEEGELDNDDGLDKVFTVMACHGALRAGHHMTYDEMAYLLEQLDRIELPTNCPHGRPIFMRFTYRQIEKMFKRVV